MRPQISGLFAGQEASEWRRAPGPPELEYSRPSQSGGADGRIKQPRSPVIRSARLVAIPIHLSPSV
jgi:hypothetical protein